MCAAVLLAAGTPALAAPAISVLVDDVPLALTPAPTVLGGILYLPLRSLARHFAVEVAVDRHGAIGVTRADGTVLTLRPDRMEVWSGELAWAVLDAPVRLVNGATFVPVSAVDVLFSALTQWDANAQTLFITTHTSFRSEAAARPAAVPTPAQAAPAPEPFAPEFVAETQGPLVASGYVTLGVAIGGSADATATAQAHFSTHEGTEHVGGTVAVAAANGVVQATGTVTVRNPLTVLTVGALTLDDSPLTLYQQGMTGLLYENMAGRGDTTYYGGDLAPTGGGSVYGVSLQLPRSDPWTVEGGLLYASMTGGMIVKARADHPLGDALTAFGEVGIGTARGATGLGWRAGLTGTSGELSTSLSYVSLTSDYPAVGHAAVFAGYSGPLLELSYRPTPQWLLLASAAALTAVGLPERATYSLLANYRLSTDIGVALDLRTTEDASSAVHTRATTATAAIAWTAGRWGVVASLSQLYTTDLLAGATASTATWSLHAGYTLGTGRPAWVEVAQSTGAMEWWSTALGWTFPTSASFDLTTALRYKVYTIPTASTESAVEIGMVQPLPTGAQLLVGAGIKYTMPGAVTTPYLTFQYGYPFNMYGTPQIGQVTSLVFTDLNGNGVRDPDEPGVPGVTVRIGGRSAAQTDSAGRVVVDGVHEGQYVVSIDEATVPTGFVAPRPELEVVVATGGTSELAFPLVPAAAVRGVVFIDENGDSQLNAGEQGVEGVVVTLQPRGELRTSDSQGAFEFAQLLPGEYTLLVDPAALPPDLKVGNARIYAVTLQPGTTVVVQIPLVSTRPIIRKTFP